MLENSLSAQLVQSIWTENLGGCHCFSDIFEKKFPWHVESMSGSFPAQKSNIAQNLDIPIW